MEKISKKKVLDLFCGCGGLSLGFKMAGFDIVGGIDFDKDSILTYSKNFKKSINFNLDISSISNEEIKKMYSGIDVLIGGPPCQGFSTANMQQKQKKDDKRNLLFFDFIRFVEILKPKVVLIENVSGILTKNKGFAKKGIENKLASLGYLVSQKILFASDYGVPQKRKRNFFIGIKNCNKKCFDFSYLEKQKIVTVGEAISDLYILENNVDTFKYSNIPIFSEYQRLMRKNAKGKVLNHNISYPNKKVLERIKFVREGRNWQDVPIYLWENNRTNRHSSAYKRLDSANVSITIDTGHMNYFHPKFDRTPTVRESARLQSFPDDFYFEGNKGSQLRQVGNAVPPLLSKRIALVIKKYLSLKL